MRIVNADRQNGVIKMVLHPDESPQVIDPDAALEIAAKLIRASRVASAARTEIAIKLADRIRNPDEKMKEKLAANRQSQREALARHQENHAAYVERMKSARALLEKAIAELRGGGAVIEEPPPAANPAAEELTIEPPEDLPDFDAG